MLDSQTMENAERRRHMRLPTRQSAELFLGSAQANHVCMVLDRSSSGVQVDLGETMDLPNTMIIQFSSQASQLVRRCWAAGTRAGMEFIGAPSQGATGADAATNGSLDLPSETGGLAATASQVAAALQQIERLIRGFLNVGQEQDAVIFSEIGSRAGGGYRHKVTIIAPQAEAAGLRIEAAINQKVLRPPLRGALELLKRPETVAS